MVCNHPEIPECDSQPVESFHATARAVRWPTGRIHGCGERIKALPRRLLIRQMELQPPFTAAGTGRARVRRKPSCTGGVLNVVHCFLTIKRPRVHAGAIDHQET